MKWSLRPEPALSLALLRIVVPLVMIVAPGFREGVRVAAWDPVRFVTPEGLGWFVAHVPIRTDIAQVCQVVAAFTAMLAVLGVYTRPALAALALSSFYLYSVAQLTGFVWHDMHLLWMCALLAVSPCGDVLAVDGRGAIDIEGRAYAIPIGFARALLAAIYFFPGLHKVMTSGLAWATGDNLLNQLYWKWLEHGAPPPLRIDRFPTLLKAGGLFVLCFELGFPLLLFTRRTRALAAVLGLFFHLLSAAIFRISFPSLWLCYVVLFDPRPAARWVAARIRRRPRERLIEAGAPVPPPESGAPGASASTTDANASIWGDIPHTARDSWPALLVGSMLLAAAVVQGARGQMASYPFACYPTFEWIAASEMPDLEIDLVDRGHEQELVHARDANGYRTQRQWGEIWRLAGVTGPVDRARLAAYLVSVVHGKQVDADQVRFYRVYRSVLPEDQGRPPTRRELLWEPLVVLPEEPAPVRRDLDGGTTR